MERFKNPLFSLFNFLTSVCTYKGWGEGRERERERERIQYIGKKMEQLPMNVDFKHALSGEITPDLNLKFKILLLNSRSKFRYSTLI